MVINLNRFVEEKEVITPIIDGHGKCDGRAVNFFHLENGWYKLSLGNKVKIKSRATPLEIYKTLKDKKHLLVFAYGEEGIPINFDNFKRIGLMETVKINFLILPLFSVAKVVKWEDGRFYFFEEERVKFREELQKIKTPNDGKGLTPEILYYSILVQLSSQSFHEIEKLDKMILSPEEKEKRLKEFANTIEERLKKIIEDSGGRFVEYRKSKGDSFVVTWKLGNQTVKSQVKGDTFAVISAGFCLDGDDKRHTMNSIVRLAKDFKEVKPLYITRE